MLASPILCEKNDRYFLGTTRGLRQDELTLHNFFQMMGAPLTIIGARVSISCLAAEALFPSMVRHSDIRLDSTINLWSTLFDRYTTRG